MLRRELSRRDFLGLAGLGVGALVVGGCGPLSGGRDLPATPKVPEGGSVREYGLTSEPLELELAGRSASTWAYGGEMPGQELRLTEGDTLRVRVENRLPAPTTVHWHGIPLVGNNDMDGVPNVTQPPIETGEDFVYEFAVPTSGSYMYHSHVGLQLDRGLYGPLVVEAKNEDLAYDREYTLMLDDWLDGVDGSPEETLEDLGSAAGGMNGGMMGEGMGRMGGGMMGGDQEIPGAVDYPLYLINGRPPEDPATLDVRRGERVRLRLMNPSADTIFRFAVAGHGLTVTHADGQLVEYTEVDVLRIGMGERYDVLLEADNPGVWQVAAAPEGKDALARAVLRYRESPETSAPPPRERPRELGGRLLTYGDLRASGRDSFPSEGLLGGPDRTHELTLSGGMGDYLWTIDGQRYPDTEPLRVAEGEWVRFEMQNRSPMWHPMHLHGHFFQIHNGTGAGPFKDTVLVEPHMGEMAFDFVADNPGEWFFHCHNAYHLETGMARIVSYER